MSNTSNIQTNMFISGAGIAGGAIITAINPNVSVTLSANATANTNNLTATLWNGNTFAGGTTVSAGTLKINGCSQNVGTNILGSPTGLGNVTFADGTTLDNSNGANTWFMPTLTLLGTLNLVGGNRLNLTFKNLELGGGTRTLNANSKSLTPTGGGTTLSSETTGICSWEMANITTLGAPVVQNGTLALASTAFSGTAYGAMRINNAMNWTAADLVIGSNVLLLVNNAGALGSSAATSPNVTVSGILDLLARSVNVKSLTGSGSVFGSMLAANATAATLSLNGSTGSTTFSGRISNGPGMGVLSLTKNGASTQILSGSNSFSGVTTILGGGTLVADNPSALGTTTNVIFGNANAQGYEGMLQLNAAPGNVFGVTISSYQNNGMLQLNYPSPALTLGALSLSQQNTLNITAGPNATGNPAVTFAAAGNTFGANNNTTVTTTLAPFGVTVSMGALSTVALTGNNGPKVNTLNLDGNGSGHQITGVISDSGVVTITNSYSAAAITKQNASTWTLSGANTYSGATAVNGGTLLIDGNSSAVTNTVTVAGGATLGGSGTLGGNVTVNANGLLSPGGATAGIATLTLASNLTLKGATLVFDLSNVAGESDRVAVSGGLTNTGANVIILNFPNGPAPAGTYTLMTYSGGRSGAGSITLAGTPYNYTNVSLNDTGTSLQLIVEEGGAYAESPFLTWKGATSTLWDTATSNWVANGAAAVYTEGSTVLFDDTAVNLTVSGSAAPGTVSFNNSVANYTVSAAMGGTGTLTKNGGAATTLAGATTYSGDTTINAGTLVVTNGGAITSPSATLYVANGTNTLAKGGVITVQTLLATNVVIGGQNKSVVSFNGGMLTTSNLNGLAASVLLPSSTSWSVNGTWNMNAGTHQTASVQTNGGWNWVYIGNSASNAAVTVNPGAVWSLGFNSTKTNSNLGMIIGNNAGGNYNTLTVNNSLLTNVAPISLANYTANGGNALIVTNGGQVFVGNGNNNGIQALTIGNTAGAYNNSLIVAGANDGNVKATVNLGNGRLYVGNVGTTGNWARVEQGGLVTNGPVFIWGVSNSVALSNGGQVFGNLACGRAGFFARAVVAGANGSGSKATWNAPTFVIGGGGTAQMNPGTNNVVLVDQGGVINATTTVVIGGGGVDTNAFGNGLCITNGGQFLSTVAVPIGYMINCNSNWVYVGGSSDLDENALLSLGTKAVTIGNDAQATGNFMTLASGGVVTNGTIVLGGISSRLYFDGGKLIARANGYPIQTNAVATDAQIVIRAGGAVFDSGTFTITNTLALWEDPASTGGGLTKRGSGKLVLLGANTYSGSNVVEAGTLTMAGAFNANLRVLSGATLNGTGTLHWQEGQVVKVDGTLDLSQLNLEIQTTGLLTIGERVIVDYASGSLSGTAFANVTGLPPKSSVVYDVTGKKIILRTFPIGTVMRVR
jgi:autotransporter-associated beta strand protein